ncbi:SMP-30/gluconolactonase/LRE family protein [Psychroserpens luteolus]|uniref:SMP-30/gluconolactonase/LRE family protein n=1 Tax=Psychroserpens luteolus TaxID=2855840 RepID=UPI001E3A0A31|nr:SMP-30/gluconolactonase/LRE family protein [Psychroserpens luteolus]MCD2259196.1 SMP-30/gluconolactonase/LRE family protein [Psychroserpens luteolus]
MREHLYFFWLLAFPLVLIGQEKPKAINNSEIAFNLEEKDLLPENIAYDPKTDTYYVGSTRKGKVVKIDKNGNETEFISPKQGGLWMVIGMKIDTNNRWLWVCSSGGDNLVGYNLKDDADGRPAGVFKFNLDTGKLIKRYVLDKRGEVHFFNDLVIDSEGNVYITHMFNEHSIYTIQKKDDALTLFLNPNGLKYPNGITITNDDRFLFVAHSEGIMRIEVDSKKLQEIKNPNALKIAKKESIDGVYFYKNTLISVHPDIKTVQKLILNENLDTIIGNKLLEVNHPMMNNPTTGVLYDSSLYYIANAQFGSFDEQGNLFPMNKLYQPIVLKINLDE